MATIGIIGGGITGLFAAYFLQKDGHDVSVIDRGDFTEGCSYGNAGMIVPSHIIPLAAPGVVLKGLKWLLNRKSPFAIRPSWDPNLLYWLWQFHRSATAEKVQAAIPHLATLSKRSKALYLEIAASGDFPLEVHEKGILMLCQSAATEAEERHVAALANAQGIEAIPMTAKELAAFDPGVQYSVRSAVYYPGDAIIDPGPSMTALQRFLLDRGVQFFPHAEVKTLHKDRGRITGVQWGEELRAFDHVVLCGGVWTGSLLYSLGFRMPLLGGKGYSFIQSNNVGLHIPSLLLDHRVSVTPYGAQVRFGGTMELGKERSGINIAKVQGIHESIRHYYPNWNSAMPGAKEVWQGYRPCSPDGLPYLGSIPGMDNLHVAAGHGMMGVSLAPAGGELIARLITHGQEPEKVFRPERFAR